MTAFSGTLGPKLREGDGQIPEGVYGIEYLNPNSRFYLSLKVSYPNASDRARAKADKRVKLGGDIMLHGKAVTIGCVPVGDDAIEDIFYLAHAVGIRNVSVIIAPYDMRKGRKPELERSKLKWYPDLCREIDIALCGSAKLYGLDDTSKEGRGLK
jgi:murein L,D-transpeptidase YafK